MEHESREGKEDPRRLYWAAAIGVAGGAVLWLAGRFALVAAGGSGHTWDALWALAGVSFLNSVLVPVGSTRAIELVADNPGDWAMHCHMTHHLMNQMGHGIPNVIGIDPRKLDERVRKVLPGYMTMGQHGMGDDMEMPIPSNTVAMRNAKGKHDVMTMGGMATVLKVRDHLTSYADPGWYDAPAETQAAVATAAEMKRDGVDPDAERPAGG